MDTLDIDLSDIRDSEIKGTSSKNKMARRSVSLGGVFENNWDYNIIN